jgi:prepilin-type N-terminal cleavage/methylation domain-containing protein
MNKSFTLIEILVVIVVIGVLSAFILVGMSSISSKANIAKGQAFINSVDNSLLLARVSQWKFDEMSGGTANDSWSSNTGTITIDSNLVGYGDSNNSGWMSQPNCVSGTCIKFDGVNDNVDCGNVSLSNSLNQITVSVWVKVISHPVGNTLDGVINKNSGNLGWQLRYYVSYWAFMVGLTGNAGDYNGATFIDTNLNNWIYLTGTYDKTNIKLYYNGELKSTVPFVKDIGQTANDVFIGKNSGWTSWFNGLIDDARVYNQAITTSEIQQSYYLGLNKLLNNNGIALNEFNQRIVELKSNLANNE